MGRFRITPGHQVTYGRRLGRMVKRDMVPGRTDMVTILFYDTRKEVTISDRNVSPAPDPGNIAVKMISIILEKAERERWSKRRTIKNLTEYCDRILKGE